MAHHTTKNGNLKTTPDARLRRLGELDNYEVADGDPDIRGWDVKTPDGNKVGKVEDLIVDTGPMKVRYVEIKADSKALGTNDDRHLLIPIGTARLNEDDDDFVIERLPMRGLGGAPAFAGGPISPDFENSLRGYYGGVGDELYDDRRFWGKRRQGRENTAYITRSEEELAVGKEKKKAGEVDVRKHVETKHVKERVPVTREEVVVERRPATSAHAKPKIGENEITIPVMEEKVVAEKRAVPKEEVVIRKETKRDEKTVEADLKKERLEIDRKGDANVSDRR